MPKRRGRGEGRVEQLPSGNWRAILPGRAKGGRSKTFDTRDQAREWLRQNLAKKAQPSGTLGEWLAEWLSLHKLEAAASTYSRDAQTVRRHVHASTLTTIKLRDLNATHVRRFLGELAAAGVSDSERHRVAATLRKALNAAVPDKLDVSPMGGKRVKMPHVERREWVAFTEEQMAAFVRAADAFGVGPMIRLWFETGLRAGEILGLKWMDWTPTAKELHVRRAVCPRTGKLKPPKSKRDRRVKIGTATAAMLSPGEPDAPMFPSRFGASHQAHTNFARGTWKPLLKLSGLEGLKLTPKSVRHSTATHLLRAGASLRAVADRLGHRDPSITLRVYAHCLPNDQERLAEMMGAFLPTLGEPA